MKRTVQRLLWISIGQFIAAIAFQLILVPNDLVATGLGGLATIFNKLFGLNIQLCLIVMALPILLWSFTSYKKKQIFYASYSFGIFTFYVGIVDALFKPFITDGTVAAVSGGVLIGIAAGIILKQAVANGPESIVAMYLKEKKGITVGNFFMVMNTCIILSSILYGDLSLIVYSFISNYISSMITDFVIVGTKRYYIVNIISDEYLDITDFIRKDLKRGVTFIQSFDTENVKKKMMLKTVVNKQELIQLEEFVKDFKDDSFVYVTESAGIVGRGFEEIN